jgi:hypothetical protein
VFDSHLVRPAHALAAVLAFAVLAAPAGATTTLTQTDLVASPHADSAPSSVAFSPAGGFVAVANAGNTGDNTLGDPDGSVQTLSLSSSGAPSTTSTETLNADPYEVAFSPGGGLLAVTEQGGGGSDDTGNGAINLYPVSSSGSLGTASSLSVDSATYDLTAAAGNSARRRVPRRSRARLARSPWLTAPTES